jgi:hypothetical protein
MEEYENIENSEENENIKDIDYELVKIDDMSLSYILHNTNYFVQGSTKVSVFDYLPLLKKGYTNSETILQLENYYNIVISYEHSMLEFNNKLNDYIFMDMINSEGVLIKQLYEFNSELNDNINIKICWFYRAWEKLLLSDNRFKLYVAILSSGRQLVDIFLKEIDPRFDNHEAYKLAKKFDNAYIINAVKTRIIQLNLLYDEVLASQLTGYEQIAQDVRLSKYL